MEKRYLMAEATRLIGVPYHKIAYALTQGYVDEPAERFKVTRMFSDEDIQRLKDYFQNRRKRKLPKEQA